MISNFESFLNENTEMTSIKKEVRLMSKEQRAYLCEYLLKKKIPVQGFDFKSYKKESPVNFNKFIEEMIGEIGEILADHDVKQRIEDNFFRIKFTHSDGYTYELGYPLDLLDRALVDDYDYTGFLRNFKTF